MSVVSYFAMILEQTCFLG